MSVASVIRHGLGTSVASVIRFGYSPGAAVAPTITTTTIPAGQVGLAYSATLAATGTEPITWAVTVGVLPAGLTLSSAGVLSGTPTVDGSYAFTVEATGPGGSDTQDYTLLIAEAAVVVTPAGGDDALRHPGWNKKRSTLKRKREREFDEQVRDIYRTLMGDPRTAEKAEAIVAIVSPPIPSRGESEAAREAVAMRRAEVLRARADAMDAQAMQAEIGLRLLYRELRQMQEDEDIEAVEFLLTHVL